MYINFDSDIQQLSEGGTSSKGRAMCYPVYGMVHIKESQRVTNIVAAVGFLYIPVNTMC